MQIFIHIKRTVTTTIFSRAFQMITFVGFMCVCSFPHLKAINAFTFLTLTL